MVGSSNEKAALFSSLTGGFHGRLHTTIEEITSLLAESTLSAPTGGGGGGLSSAEKAELEQLRALAKGKSQAPGGSKEELAAVSALPLCCAYKLDASAHCGGGEGGAGGWQCSCCYDPVLSVCLRRIAAHRELQRELSLLKDGEIEMYATRTASFFHLTFNFSQALKAKEELEVENAKLKYRITHLLRAIDPSNASAPASSAPDLSMRKGGCLIGGRFQ